MVWFRSPPSDRIRNSAIVQTDLYQSHEGFLLPRLRSIIVGFELRGWYYYPFFCGSIGLHAARESVAIHHKSIMNCTHRRNIRNIGRLTVSSPFGLEGIVIPLFISAETTPINIWSVEVFIPVEPSRHFKTITNIIVTVNDIFIVVVVVTVTWLLPLLLFLPWGTQFPKWMNEIIVTCISTKLYQTGHAGFVIYGRAGAPKYIQIKPLNAEGMQCLWRRKAVRSAITYLGN